MTRDRAFNFFMALVKALHQNRTEILAKTAVCCAGSNDPQSRAALLLDNFIGSSLDGAKKHWCTVTSASVLDAIKSCIVTGQMNMCQAFLDRAWNASGDVTHKFDSIYTPLIPQLCGLLTQTKIDICTAPFSNFFCLLISHYLHYVLSSKGQNFLQPRNVDCFSRNCSDCRALNEFLFGRNPRHSFHFVQKTRSHLETQLSGVRDLVIYEPQRIGRSQYMMVTKTPAVLAGSRWAHRIHEIKGLFQAIGTKNVEKIMGNRYADVCKALEGQSGFRLNTAVVQPQNVHGRTAAGATVGKRKRS